VRNSAIASASVSPFGETTAKDHFTPPKSLNEGGSSPFNRLRSSSYAGQEERGSLAKASGEEKENNQPMAQFFFFPLHSGERVRVRVLQN